MAESILRVKVQAWGGFSIAWVRAMACLRMLRFLSAAQPNSLAVSGARRLLLVRTGRGRWHFA